MRYQIMKRHGGTLMHITKWKEAIAEKATYYGSKYMTFWKRQNYEDNKIIRFPEVGDEGRDEWVKHKESLGQWKYSVWYYKDGYVSLYICLNS